jgi:hypothetical protein
MVHRTLLDEGQIEALVSALRAIAASNPELPTRSESELGISKTTPSACATPNFAPSTCSPALASSKLDAKP